MQLTNLDDEIRRLEEPTQPIWFDPPVSKTIAERTGRDAKEGSPLTIRRALITLLGPKGDFENAEDSLRAHSIGQRLLDSNGSCDISAEEHTFLRKTAHRVLFKDPDVLWAIEETLNRCEE